jgi:predicted nucleic acid-binding protein
MYLIDTNIFLEILLGQEKKTDCKEFLEEHIGNLNISDFSLHSIGVILFRYGKEDLFKHFLDDVLPSIDILSIPGNLYHNVIHHKKRLNFDFDDAYQYSIAENYGLTIVTLDNDFKKVKNSKIIFL